MSCRHRGGERHKRVCGICEHRCAFLKLPFLPQKHHLPLELDSGGPSAPTLPRRAEGGSVCQTPGCRSKPEPCLPAGRGSQAASESSRQRPAIPLPRRCGEYITAQPDTLRRGTAWPGPWGPRCPRGQGDSAPRGCSSQSGYKPPGMLFWVLFFLFPVLPSWGGHPHGAGSCSARSPGDLATLG